MRRLDEGEARGYSLGQIGGRRGGNIFSNFCQAKIDVCWSGNPLSIPSSLFPLPSSLSPLFPLSPLPSLSLLILDPRLPLDPVLLLVTISRKM
jgi:hypothetical protein